MDIVITTALIPNQEAPELWTADMVASMKPGSVIVDLAAEKGGNCKLTVIDDRIVTENGVIIIGYTDFPSRMAAQASSLYASNIRHMISDLTPGKDGVIVHDMEMMLFAGQQSFIRVRLRSLPLLLKFKLLQLATRKEPQIKPQKKFVLMK